MKSALAQLSFRIMADPPSTAVLSAFNLSSTPSPLAGGEGHSWSCDSLVFKPCADPVEWTWLGERLPSVVQEGFRLALPVRATDGRWVVDGWCAQPLLAGAHPDDGRDAGYIAGADHRFAAFAADRAVFGIDENPVEAEEAEELGHVGAGPAD